MKLVTQIVTPDSSLGDNPTPLFIGDRARPSTCEAVAWIGDDTLVTANLAGETLDVYDYDGSLHHRQRLSPRTRLSDVSLSPDGTCLAVSQSRACRVLLHPVVDKKVSAATKASRILGKHFVHGVCFDPTGKHLLVFQWEKKGRGTIWILDADSLKVVSKTPTPISGLQTKAACFTGASLILAHGCRGQEKETPVRSAISVHTFHKGALSEPQRVFDGFKNIESFANLGDGEVLAVDQYLAQVLHLTFSLGGVVVKTLLGSENGLGKFPHGISVSPSGLVAVTDHEQDMVQVFG